MTRVVAVCCRLSPRPDGTYEGVDLQEGWGRRYAANTWPGVPVEVFAERGISAARDDVRPEHERFRQWVRDGRVAHVWTVEQSRLERREIEWFQLAAELDAAGITEVHTDRDGIVRVHDEVAGIKAVLNAAEVRKLRRRVNDRLAENAARGRPPGSRPFGYVHGENDDGEKTYLQVPEQADAVRRAADLVLAGWSLGNIAAELQAQGVVGAFDGKIVGGTVKRMVTNPTIAGYRVYRGDIVGRGNWEPILDETTWQAVRAKLSGNRTTRRADGRAYAVGDAHRAGFRSSRAARKYLLSGIAVCGVCQAPMVATLKQVRGRHPAYLVCHPNRGGRGCTGVLYDPTEAHVLEQLWTEVDKPEFLRALTDDGDQARRDELLAALAALGAQRQQLAAMWAGQQLTTDEWQAARAGLDQREADLRTDLADVPVGLDVVDFTAARDVWSDLTLDEQRAVVSRIIDAVVVHRAVPGARAFDPARITVRWRTFTVSG